MSEFLLNLLREIFFCYCVYCVTHIETNEQKKFWQGLKSYIKVYIIVVYQPKGLIYNMTNQFFK